MNMLRERVHAEMHAVNLMCQGDSQGECDLATPSGRESFLWRWSRQLTGVVSLEECKTA